MIRSLIYFFLFMNVPLGWASVPQGGCFDFSKKKIVTPLHQPPKLKKNGDSFEHGMLKKGEVPWASGRGIIERPIEAVYGWLLDHTNWKDMSRTEVKTTKIKSPHYLELHKVFIDFHVWAFIYVDWEEEWAYALTKGTPKKPKEILISYQRAGGTSNLKHLCGSIILRSLGKTSTDAYFHEQCKATHHNVEEILKMHRKNFMAIRS